MNHKNRILKKSKLTCKTENEEYKMRRFKVEPIFVLKDYKLSNPKLRENNGNLKSGSKVLLENNGEKLLKPKP